MVNILTQFQKQTSPYFWYGVEMVFLLREIEQKLEKNSFEASDKVIWWPTIMKRANRIHSVKLTDIVQKIIF